MTAVIDWPGLWELARPGAGEPPAAAAIVPPPVSSRRETCTARAKQTGERCKRWPVAGATVCKIHGGGAPQVRDKAAQRLQEREALALARQTAGDLDLTQFSDPFSALETALGHQHALALRLLAIVEAIPDGELRYQGKLGEQLRGEVTAAQRALADLRAAAEGSLRLGLAERRQRLEESKVEHLVRALDAALRASGLDPDGQERARQVLQRELARPVAAIEAGDG